MAIGLQLLLDDVQVSHGILGSCVHEVDQQTGAFDMTQKVVAKTSALGGPSIKPGISANTVPSPLGGAPHQGWEPRW